jgi:hypothetical protein
MTFDDMKRDTRSAYTRYWIHVPQAMRAYILPDDKYKKSWDSTGVVINSKMDRWKIEEIIEGVAYLSFQYVSIATGEETKNRTVFGKGTIFLPTIANFPSTNWDNYSMHFDGESAAPLYSFLKETYPSLMNENNFSAWHSNIPFAGKMWRFADLGQIGEDYSGLSYSLDNGPDTDGEFHFVKLDLKWLGEVEDPIRYDS